MNQKKKFKRFSQKTLTIHHIRSNCDVLDKKKKMKIYILLVCHNQCIKNCLSWCTYSRHIKPIADMQ